eukprot:3532319-Rhodomonas_salina.1
MIFSPPALGTPDPRSSTLLSETATPLPSSLQNSANDVTFGWRLSLSLSVCVAFNEDRRVWPASACPGLAFGRQGSLIITISVVERMTSLGGGGTAVRAVDGAVLICVHEFSRAVRNSIAHAVVA